MRKTLISCIHTYLRESRRTGDSAERQRSKPAGKKYPRLSQISLPPPAELRLTLQEALDRRFSIRNFIEGGVLELSDISSLFYHALAEKKNGARPYPSGGALFPVETYLLARTVSGLPFGVFHYKPASHTLEYLWDMPEDTEIFGATGTAPSSNAWAERSSAILFFTGVWEQSSEKYSDFAYILGLLEAGHAAQNILLAATSLGIGARPLAGFNDKAVRNILDIDGEEEQPIYAIILCKQQTS